MSTTTTPSTSTAVATVRPVFSESERFALAGYLAGYRGLTREACTLDLRQFAGWCRDRSLPLFCVRRADIETFARELEDKGRARASVTRRLSAIARFCKYAIETSSSTTHRRPTSGVPAWTTSPTRPVWTATRPARSSSRPGSGPRPNMP